MESESPSQPETPQTPSNEMRADQLLALRAPLIERGKKVPALERSIAAHEVEAKALYALLCSANIAERVLLEERNEALREIEIVKLHTNLVRERLRTADKQLAETRDIAHVKETAHAEALNTLRKRCSAMKRKIDNLTTGQKRELETRIRHLENTTDDFRKEILEITNMRDEWRETAISTEQQLNELKTEHAKLQTVSALLETERTLSASLRIYLKDARQAATTAEQENAKLAARASGKEKTDKALQAEKEKNAQLRQKLKDANTSSKKLSREEAKLRQKCDDLEKRLDKALTRAVKAEEQAAELMRPTTRSRGMTTPRQDALISPAPLTFRRRTAEDMASESRSRFTATLPQGIQDDGSIDGEESEVPSPRPRKPDSSPRMKRRKPPTPQKLPPPQKTIAKRVPRRTKADSDLLKTPETKKRRQPTDSRKSNGPTTRGDGLATSPAQRNVASPRAVTPRRKHGKATRKTTASTRAKRPKEPPREESGSSDFPRRTLRSRPPVSYNYDEEEGESDFDYAHPRADVDYVPLQPLRVTRSAKRQGPDSDFSPEGSEGTPDSEVVSPSAKRPRRIETVRKQVPNTRSGVK